MDNICFDIIYNRIADQKTSGDQIYLTMKADLPSVNRGRLVHLRDVTPAVTPKIDKLKKGCLEHSPKITSAYSGNNF